MENQHRQIKGYRELSQSEIDLMNAIKEQGIKLEQIVRSLRDNEQDQIIVHVTPKQDEECDHDWPGDKDGRQIDMYGQCTKCGMSFQRYMHCFCP